MDHLWAACPQRCHASHRWPSHQTGPIPKGEEGKLREQFDGIAVLYQRVSPRRGQDESEHTLRIAPKAKAKASLHWQKPGNGAAGVSTGVTPEAVVTLTFRDFWVYGAPIRGELLFAMREPPAPQGEAQRMDRGIREGNSQRKRRRAPGDWLERANGIHDMLGPVLEGVDLRIQGPSGAVRREVVALWNILRCAPCPVVRTRATGRPMDLST